MRQVMRKGLITVAAATGALAAAGGLAHADSGAAGSAAGSPGVASGNNVQVPVHIPVNVCGNTVDIVGLFNDASGNACATTSASGSSGSGSAATGQSSDSPGVGSGNNVQVPVDVPVNACGDSVNVIGVGNTAEDSTCTNEGGGIDVPPPSLPPAQPPENPGTPEQPGKPHQPSQPADHEPQGSISQPAGSEQLAETGSGLPLGASLAASGGALLAGAVLYRKARARA